MRDMQSNLFSEIVEGFSNQTNRSHPISNQPDLPPTDSLPDFDPQNPWRSTKYASLSGGMLTIEGIGTRPIPDFERFPVDGEFPYVWVRLSQEASVREAKVPKETVIYPKEKAQSSYSM